MTKWLFKYKYVLFVAFLLLGLIQSDVSDTAKVLSLFVFAIGYYQPRINALEAENKNLKARLNRTESALDDLRK